MLALLRGDGLLSLAFLQALWWALPELTLLLGLKIVILVS